MPKIYVAGPLFTEGQRWLLERVDAVCRARGFETYLPHRDAGLYDRDSDSSFFFQQDLRQLQEADAVVAVLNGDDVDSGTAWEMGYFYAIKGGPIVGYVNDTRRPHPKAQLNPMVVGCLQVLVQDLDSLADALEDLKRSSAG